MSTKDNKDIKIVAVVGMSGSGKSTAIEYLTARGIPKVYFGGVIYKAMEEAGIPRTEDGESEKKFREEIRQKEGKDFVVLRAIQEAKKQLPDRNELFWMASIAGPNIRFFVRNGQPR